MGLCEAREGVRANILLITHSKHGLNVTFILIDIDIETIN